MVQVEVIKTDALGDRSYVVHDGEVALVVDPQRDVDRVEALVAERRLRITHVAETHLHNDYVTGGAELARRHGAAYLVAEGEGVRFDHRPVRPGERIGVGGLSVRAVATPGHTEHHVSYVVEDGAEQAVFSGGSLLYGSVGRTDLVDPNKTAELTRAQYRSARELAEQARPDAALYPTHGFGSFCSSGPAAETDISTVGEQRERNHALTEHDEERFVEQLIANLTDYPAYYAHMAPLNKDGPGVPELTVPEPVDAAALRERIVAGEWVVDLRNRVAFANKHLAGTVSFEYGDGKHFTTFLGWTVPWGEPLTLVGPGGEVRAAIRDLARIGIDRPDVAVGDPASGLAGDHPRSSFPSVGWEEVADEFAKGNPPTVLDVRRADEFKSQHVEGALHIPLHELLSRMDELERGRRLWVHCGSGYRSAVAASLLESGGHSVVHIDGDYSEAASAGVPVT
ncbi:glyoxylase-like metal-dependent hydrolase (beta-lactamase superfamily II)/rhodanese-related sulfurtransferase [Saccharomonospora amisosensis]|uniref:Glyoxylase-like metal-dependent hydrolase (Beta-lactamase superfamily II)/rhodanese-related sulfurtransferase n=1 Tax=Saccharomonospora amisosensis TaxID=1128677 RepID=A0A7X5ZNZ6_9PSEU|nr:glyoxylase-like metal-dependent hydrolase (beta-lactamase superfamily II)/rhodanese-related sulfurtransferase [Saccharomonospora amisosensis]